jgi:hypothetical protein
VSNRKADLLSDLIKPRNPIEDNNVKSNAQTSEHTNEQTQVQTSESPSTQTIIVINEGSDEHKPRYSFNLPMSLHLKLKIHAASRRKTMSDIVEEAVRQYLSSSK